jgi:hypothetical protein
VCARRRYARTLPLPQQMHKKKIEKNTTKCARAVATLARCRCINIINQAII